MKTTLKKLHKNRIFSLIFWLVAVFIAIIVTPGIAETTNHFQQPHFNEHAQTNQAQAIKKDWGHGLGNTDSVSLVYHAKQGTLNQTQQTQIESIAQKLHKNQRFYGIKKVTTLKNDLAGKNQLVSPDNTTQVVKIVLDSKNNLNILSQQILQDSDIIGLDSYITSPKLIQSINTGKNLQITKIVLVALFIASMLIVGIYFKSLLIPLISLVTGFSAYVITLAIVLNLVAHYHFPFSQFVPLEIGISILVLGTVWNIYMFKKLRQILDFQADPTYITKQMISVLRFPITIVGITLAIAFGGAYFIDFQAIQTLSGMGIAYLLLTLVVLTLTPVFTAALGESVFWPAKKPLQGSVAKFWNRITEFSLWQPFASILVVLCITLPFVYNYRQSISFSPSSNLTATDQATQGAKILNTHFAQGKATPVTIYLKNDQPLDNEKYLQQLDALTTKLQSESHVNSVYSVTQPSGMPISKYYVANQLNSIKTQVDGSASILTKLSNDIKDEKANLELDQLKQLTNQTNQAAKQIATLSSTGNSVQAQINQANTQTRNAQRFVVKSKQKQYERNLAQLSTSLNEADHNLQNLTAQINSISNYGESSFANLKIYQAQVKKVRDNLSDISEEAKGTNDQLDNVYGYLNGLQKSSAANVYYITKDQLADTDFLQSMYNYTSADKKITALEVIFDNPADNKYNLQEIKSLQALIHNQLQGTPLANAKVAMTGEPIVAAQLQSGMKHSLLTFVIYLIVIILLAVFILSRAILQPVYWMLTFILSAITGTQLTYITMNFISGSGNLDWQTFPIALVGVTAIAAWQIIVLGLSYRYTTLSLLEWIKPTMASYGQIVRYILIVVIVLAASMTFGASNTLIAAALISIYTFAIYYLVLPMVVTSFGTLSVTLPNKENLLK